MNLSRFEFTAMKYHYQLVSTLAVMIKSMTAEVVALHEVCVYTGVSPKGIRDQKLLYSFSLCLLSNLFFFSDLPNPHARVCSP